MTDFWFALAALAAAFLATSIARYQWRLWHKGYKVIGGLMLVAAAFQFYRAGVFVARAWIGTPIGGWLTPVVWVPDLMLAIAMSMGHVVMVRLDTLRGQHVVEAARRLARLPDVE